MVRWTTSTPARACGALGCVEAEWLCGKDGRRASSMGRVTDAGSELAAVLWSGSEQDGSRGDRDLGVRAQGHWGRRGRSDGEAIGMGHVVQMEPRVDDALEARQRDHENESDRERAPPHDDEHQQGKYARREGERRRRRVVREDGAVGGYPLRTRVRAADGRVPRMRPSGAGQGGKQERHAHDNDQPGPPADGRDLILLQALRTTPPLLHHARHPSLTAAPARAHLLPALAVLAPVPAGCARAPIAR